jgi:WD40 repeat protein
MRLADALDEFDQEEFFVEGRLFGQFRLRKLLGSGGFGLVLLADDLNNGREVALKVPRLSALLRPEKARLVRRDLEAIKLLDHPGIVPIYDAPDIDKTPCLVMPYIPGPDLKKWLADQSSPVPLADAVALIVELADIAQHAHERGVLHCDLKPANVLLQPLEEGERKGLAGFRPKITDFGLARLMSAPDEQTRTTLASGSPPYTAPEQAAGTRRGLTARCDVHALAAILYELLVGRPPYGRPDEEGITQKLISPEVAPEPPGPNVPCDLGAVVLKGLAKKPEDRYASAKDFADDLRLFQNGEPTVARPVGPLGQLSRLIWRKPFAAACVALLLLAAGIVGFAADRDARREEELRRKDEEAERRDLARQLELRLTKETAARRDFYQRLERVRRRAVERPDGWAKANLREIKALATSPAAAEELPELRSQAAAALALPRLELERKLAPDMNAYVVAFSPDGRTLALGERYPDDKQDRPLRVWLIGLDGKLRRTLNYPVDHEWEKSQEGRWADGARSILFTPNGHRLAVGTRAGNVYTWDLTRPKAPARGRRLRPDNLPPTGDCTIRSLVVDTTGSVLYASRRGHTDAWDMASGKAIPLPAECELPLNSMTTDDCWCQVEDHWVRPHLSSGEHTARCWKGNLTGWLPFGLSPDGEAMVVHWDIGGVTYWAMPTGRFDLARPLFGATNPTHAESLAFTPDGRYLALGSECPPAFELRDAFSRELVTRRPHHGGSGSVAFSPDGRHLAVCVQNRTLLFQLHRSETYEAATTRPQDIGHFAVSDDGQALFTLQASLDSGPGREGGVPGCALSLYRRTSAGLVEDERTTVPLEGVASRLVSVVPDGGREFGVFARLNERVCGVKTTTGTFRSTAGDATAFRLSAPNKAWIAGPKGLQATVIKGTDQLACSFEPKEERANLRFLALDVFGRGHLCGGLSDGRLLLFDAAGTPVDKQQAFKSQEVRSLSTWTQLPGLGPKDGWTLAGSSSGNVALVQWDDGARILRATERPHTEAVTGVAWLPDGAFITVSEDQTIRLWAGLDRPILTLREHGKIKQAELRGGKLYVRVAGDWCVRVHHLDVLAKKLRDLGLDPGFRTAPNGPTSQAPVGLRNTVFTGRNFTCEAHRRYTPDVSLRCGKGKPSKWAPSGPYSVRWEGWARPPQPGQWELKVEAIGSARLWIGDKLHLSQGPDFPKAHAGEGTATVEFPAEGKPLRLDYLPKPENGQCRLLWRPQGKGPFVPVPPTALSSLRPSR